MRAPSGKMLAVTMGALLGVGGVPGSVGGQPPPEQSASLAPSDDNSGGSGAAPTLDQIFSLISGKVPNFGGSWVEGDTQDSGQEETLHLFLTQSKNEQERQDAIEASQKALVTHLGERFNQSDVIVHDADFTWKDLHDWRQLIRQSLDDMTGPTSLDIDEQQNRIVMGLVDPDLQARNARNRLEAINVPQEAVKFIERPRVSFQLRQNRRPLVGGLQIEYQAGLFGLDTKQCTLGYTVKLDGVIGFITNSHCSRTTATVDDARYWQPNRPITQANQVGVETVDPGHDPDIGGCPDGSICRQSDSNFVDTSVTSFRGTIADVPPGTVNWNGDDVFKIVALELPAIDAVVCKTGRTTGRTCGTIINTCVDVGGNGDLWLFCQGLADYASDGGDSGSPVFRIVDFPDPGDVRAVGLHWGAFLDLKVFSSIHRVRTELTGGTNIDGLHICAAGFNC